MTDDKGWASSRTPRIWRKAADEDLAELRTVKTHPGLNILVQEALDFAELAAVLEAIQKKSHDKYPNGQISLVGFDACDLSLIEVANVLAPFARYLVASEIGIPIPGWPYDRVFKRLSAPVRSRVIFCRLPQMYRRRRPWRSMR